MSDDITDRLRAMPHTTMYRKMCAEAADEIERLRKALSTVICGDGPKHEFITISVPAIERQAYPSAISSGAHQHNLATKIQCRWCGCDTVTKDYSGVCSARLMAMDTTQ